MNICAGIVLFNPEIERLNENIEHIRKQVPMVILVDNGSSNLEDVKSLIYDLPNIILLENGKNLGIAQALNRILRKAQKEHYE
ncbi:glycosyltransferase, partial [Bradyrhizobium sp. BRP05]|nr:glycosyltransferase [Bradyrhizobium sp. BRP05]